MRSLERIVAGTPLGAFLGFVGGFLIWDYLYAIGARVISDELYYDWQDPVRMTGGIFGAASAFLKG